MVAIGSGIRGAVVHFAYLFGRNVDLHCNILVSCFRAWNSNLIQHMPATFKLILGDSKVKLKQLEANSVDSPLEETKEGDSL